MLPSEDFVGGYRTNERESSDAVQLTVKTVEVERGRRGLISRLCGPIDRARAWCLSLLEAHVARASPPPQKTRLRLRVIVCAWSVSVWVGPR